MKFDNDRYLTFFEKENEKSIKKNNLNFELQFFFMSFNESPDEF